MIGKIKIDGVQAVQKKLDWLQLQSRRHNNVGVIVGYSASYALYVHENQEMKWKGLPRDPRKWHYHPDTGKQITHRKKKSVRDRKINPKGRYWDPQGRGQNKFLETPFRVLRGTLINNVYTITKSLGIARGNGLDKGLYTTGLLLQRVSQELVPVNFALLKASAFTRLIHDNRGKG